MAFALALLAAEHVAVAPVETFGAAVAGWVRVSLAGERSELVEGVRRLVRFVEDARTTRPSVTAGDAAVR